MPHDCRSHRYQQEQRDHTLIAPTIRPNATLAPDAYARLTCDIRVDDLTVLCAGTFCEITGEYLRFRGGKLVCRSVLVDGVRVPALTCVERLPVVDKGE